jgi:hypothetical protein
VTAPDRTETLRLILDADLPMPRWIRFSKPDAAISSCYLDFDTVDEWAAWAEYIGVSEGDYWYQPADPHPDLPVLAYEALRFDFMGWQQFRVQATVPDPARVEAVAA